VTGRREPELEYLSASPTGSAATGFSRYANSPGNIYVVYPCLRLANGFQVGAKAMDGAYEKVLAQRVRSHGRAAAAVPYEGGTEDAYCRFDAGLSLLVGLNA